MNEKDARIQNLLIMVWDVTASHFLEELRADTRETKSGMPMTFVTGVMYYLFIYLLL